MRRRADRSTSSTTTRCLLRRGDDEPVVGRAEDHATAGTFWAAYFAPTDPRGETVYALDTAGGIDVLQIGRSGRAPSVRAKVTSRMLAGTPAVRRSDRWGFACPIPPAVRA